MLTELGQTSIPVFKNQALNERDYGELVGLNKDDARKKWGEEQVHIWRRSYDVAPPGGESLKDTLARALPYYITEILPRVMRGEHVLVAAHGNSLRALVMVLDKHTPDSITKLNLETGVPMIYRLNADLTVASKLDLAALAYAAVVIPASQPSMARFRVSAPMVAGQVAALTDDPVARDYEADRVFADGGADGARRFGEPALAARSEYVVTAPIGISSNFSQTRTSKSVPIRTTRSGRSLRHSA